MTSSTLTKSSTVVSTERSLSTTIDGETVILHRDVGKYYGLNEVGTFVWELIQEPRSVDELCQEVTEEYDVEPERCRNDIKELLVDLAEKNLVQLTEA